MLVGREAEGLDDAPFNRMEGWGPDCHQWTGASMARPAEKCGPTIICPPNPFSTLHLLTCLSRVFQRRSLLCALFGAQRKWRYYWKHRLKFGLFSFSSAVVNPHGFVGNQELLVENDRAAGKPQCLGIREISNAVATEIVPYFIQNIEVRLVKRNGAFLAGRAIDWLRRFLHNRRLSRNRVPSALDRIRSHYWENWTRLLAVQDHARRGRPCRGSRGAGRESMDSSPLFPSRSKRS